MKIKDTNKIIFIDLDQETIEIKDVPQELLRMYLGGRGINSYLLYKYTDASSGPLCPENVFIVGTGLLTGLKGLNFSRTTISAKSPESGFLGDANIGGGFGVNLRKNGYGYIVVKQKALSPKILVIGKDQITIEDAQELWGKDTQMTQEDIHQRYPKSEVLCIGAAGENQVVFACVMNRRKNAAARCGMGAVMGSKNLKAIVALDNSEELEVEDKQGFTGYLKDMNKSLQSEFLIDRLKEFGSSHLFEIVNESIGMGRVKNGRTLAFTENQNINHKNLKQFHKERAGCKNCTLRCHYTYEYNGIKNEGPEYGVMAHFGPVLGIGRIEDILVLNDMVNRLGMDASSTANTIAWMIELYQEGIIDKNFTQGRELKWSSPEMICSLIEEIAQRKGLGDFLARGPKGMLKELPSQARDYLCWTKNLVQSEPADLRYLPAFALSNSVASRGSDHLRSRPVWVSFEFPSESMESVYGDLVDSDVFSYLGKGKVIFWWEHYLAMFDMLGLCKFLGFHTLPPGIKFSFFQEVIKTGCGEDFTEDHLKEIGERVINMERLYLQREGITRKDDYPPQKVFLPLKETEGMREEDKGRKLDKGKYDTMLDDYYKKRGWTMEGKLNPKTIERLKLDKEIDV